MKRTMIALLLYAGMANLQAQEWLTAGNGGLDPVTNFLGNTDAVPMNIRTEDIRRFRLNYDESYTIGSFTSQVKNGSLLLSPDVDQFYTNGAPGPFSLFHVAAADDNAQEGSYREWMGTGISLTGNADHAYWGLKAAALDYTDVVLHWSDNPSKWLKDRMRFIFTSNFDESATGAGSLEGLEGMRLFPVDDDNVNVGIGDWYAANVNSSGAITEPEERLDIVDGKVRIRQLPDDAPTEDEKVMVVDDDGVVHWRPIEDFAGQTDCDWVIQNGGTSGSSVPHNLVTAYGTNDACPDADDFVGIGTSAPSSKLDVRYAPSTGTSITSGSFSSDGGATVKVAGAFSAAGAGTHHYAVRADAINGNDVNVGVIGWSIANDGGTKGDLIGTEGVMRVINGSAVTNAIGLKSTCDVSATSTNAYGVHAQTWNYAGSVTNNYGGLFHSWTSNGSSTNFGVKGIAEGGCLNYSVYAQAPSSTYGCDRWALYVNGAQYSTTSDVFTTSDESLKSGIAPADVGAASHLLESVQLHTYEFNTTEHPQLQLPDGPQLGVLAGELEVVLPRLVRTVHQPSVTDGPGTEAHPGLEFKAVSYTGLIPYLIAGHQAQQTEMDELRAQLSELQAQLAACCTQPNTDQRIAPATGLTGNDQLATGEARLLRIAPNPFIDRTTLHCTLERSGRMQLLVNSADGRDLRVLSEALREAGDYQVEWDTTRMAPGVYYITLLLDGEPLVKRAVKL